MNIKKHSSQSSSRHRSSTKLNTPAHVGQVQFLCRQIACLSRFPFWILFVSSGPTFTILTQVSYGINDVRTHHYFGVTVPLPQASFFRVCPSMVFLSFFLLLRCTGSRQRAARGLVLRDRYARVTHICIVSSLYVCILFVFMYCCIDYVLLYMMVFVGVILYVPLVCYWRLNYCVKWALVIYWIKSINHIW